MKTTEPKLIYAVGIQTVWKWPNGTCDIVQQAGKESFTWAFSQPEASARRLADLFATGRERRKSK